MERWNPGVFKRSLYKRYRAKKTLLQIAALRLTLSLTFSIGKVEGLVELPAQGRELWRIISLSGRPGARVGSVNRTDSSCVASWSLRRVISNLNWRLQNVGLFCRTDGFVVTPWNRPWHSIFHSPMLPWQASRREAKLGHPRRGR